LRRLIAANLIITGPASDKTGFAVLLLIRNNPYLPVIADSAISLIR